MLSASTLTNGFNSRLIGGDQRGVSRCLCTHHENKYLILNAQWDNIHARKFAVHNRTTLFFIFETKTNIIEIKFSTICLQKICGLPH